MGFSLVKRIRASQFLLIFVIIVVGLAACSGQDTAPMETVAVTPSPSPTEKPEMTSTPTSTLSPTMTLTPWLTPTPKPYPLPPGEYILYKDEYGVPGGLYAFSDTNQEILQVLKGYPIFVSSSGKFIYSILESNEVRVVGLETGQSKIGKLPEDCRDQPPISMSLDPAWVVGACGFYGKEIWLFPLEEDQEILQFDSMNDVGIWDLSWAPNGETIAYWGEDREVYEPTWKSGLYFLTLDCEVDYSACEASQVGPFLANKTKSGYIAWSSDSRYLAVNLDPYDRTIIIFDTATNQVVQETFFPEVPIYDFVWSPDGQQLAESTKEGIYLIPSMGGDQYDYELLIDSPYTVVRGWITLEEDTGD